MKLLSRTVFGALSVLSINVFANDLNEFDYIGIGYQHHGYDSLNFAPNLDTAELSPLIYDAKSSAAGFRGYVGHQFNRYIAIEAGITSFGKADFALVEKEQGADGKTKIKKVQGGEFSTLAGDIRLVGTYGLSDSLFLKAHIGALAWNNEFDTLVRGDEGVAVQDSSDSGVSLLTGLGVGYGFNKKCALSLDIERTKIAGIKTQNLGLSFLVRF